MFSFLIHFKNVKILLSNHNHFMVLLNIFMKVKKPKTYVFYMITSTLKQAPSQPGYSDTWTSTNVVLTKPLILWNEVK